MTISGDLTGQPSSPRTSSKKSPAPPSSTARCAPRLCPSSSKTRVDKAIRTKAGHSIIKPQMRENDAAFGGEHSGHFYFRDNYFADSGIIAMLTVAELVAREEEPVSELLAPIDPYVRSGEINSEVEDQEATLQKVEEHYAQPSDPKIDHLDGLTVDSGTGGSTSAPRTPNPCSASTSRPATGRPWSTSATGCSASSEAEHTAGQQLQLSTSAG